MKYILVIIGETLPTYDEIVNRYERCLNYPLTFYTTLEERKHPKAIKATVELVVREYDELLICTHSPYVLTTLNNLIYAGWLYSKGYNIPDKYKDSKILPKELQCYEYKDGKFIDIIDGEEGLIMAERIDDVSELINQEFNDLCDIIYKKKL